METDFAGLTLEEEEYEILQIQTDAGTNGDVEILQLVGCFLTARANLSGPMENRSSRDTLNPVLGINLVGRGYHTRKGSGNWSGNMENNLMEHDLEDEVIVGEEGKKRNRREMEDALAKEVTNVLVEMSRRAVEGEEGYKWRFTGFYRSPYSQERAEAWNLLRHLGTIGELPWMEGRMEAFRKILKECNLSDIEFNGNWFTWERGNLPKNDIQERLDRAIATEDWLQIFPEFQIQHLPHTFSDHCPLLVKNIWEHSEGDFLCKPNNMKRGLERWSRQIRNLTDTKIQLNLEIEKDGRYWEQRGRVNWLKLGDKNTAFFHKQATQKRQRNLIRKMQNDNGREMNELQEMEMIARMYFQKLFSAGRKANYEHVLSGVSHYISDEDNLMLKERYTKEEIQQTLSESGTTKAPGEDGFPVLFYQKCWATVGEEVTTFCLNHLN
ncbi:hypothetical protein Gotri_024592 [Gossypium trilobum]|uniref:Reverse transcriptase n=1 Tax=Gossypium trilobum TaxID=34281 RepID=A0A7J9DMR5_9ROSI|nr:hypothetical protein [Gossypium trilobum]